MRPVPEFVARFIAKREGGQSSDGLFHPYYDSNGNVWTQGFGHTADVGPRSRPWTREHAELVLRRDLARHYAPPVDALKLPLSARQRGAVISAVYNLGPGVLDSDRSLGGALRAHHWAQAANAFLLYDKDANGQRLLGLTRRRRAERRMFLRGSSLRTRLRAARLRRFG